MFEKMENFLTEWKKSERQIHKTENLNFPLESDIFLIFSFYTVLCTVLFNTNTTTYITMSYEIIFHLI